MTSSNLFIQALEAAHSGDHPQACELLRQMLQTDPRNEEAWLWLGSLADDPDEQISALEKALRINPQNNLARSRLELLYMTGLKSRRRGSNLEDQLQSQAGEWLREAEKAQQEGQEERALETLLRYVEIDDQNEKVWYMLSDLVPGAEDKIIALENVLTLNPTHAGARSCLERLRRAAGHPLTLGILYEEQGDLDNAINQYIQASMQAHTLADRLEIRRRLELAQLRVKAPDYKPTSPKLTLARLAIGPALLFGGLLLLHGGMQLSQIWLPLLLGGLCILLGSALVVLTNTMPILAYWYSWWQKRGFEDEEFARLSILLLGLFLLLAPYTLLFLNAFDRLNAILADLTVR